PGAKKESEAEVGDVQLRKGTALGGAGGIEPPSVAAFLDAQNDMVEYSGRRKPVGDVAAMAAGDERRRGVQSALLEHGAEQQGLVFAIPKTAAHHLAGRRGLMGTDAGFDAEVADFLLDETQCGADAIFV